MTLPDHLAVTDAKYDYILFLPLGRKHKHVRSFGHKHTRGVLTRVNTAVEEILWQLPESHKEAFDSFTGGRLPLPVSREDSISPYLWKPDAFLWQAFRPQHGVPFKQEQLYTVNLFQASKQGLYTHLQTVIQEYVMCAHLARMEREEFLLLLQKLHQQHPLIRLYNTYKTELAALPDLQKAPFLFIMKNQERVSFWRERWNVMMRPFRSAPLTIDHLQAEHMQMMFQYPYVKLYFPKQDVTLLYEPFYGQVELPQDMDYDLIEKRLRSVLAAWDELLIENQWLLDRFREMAALQKQMHTHKSTILTLRKLYMQAQESGALDSLRVLEMLDQLELLYLPVEHEKLELIQLSRIRIPDITLLTKWEAFAAAFTAEWSQIDATMAQLEQLTKQPIILPLSIPKQTAVHILSFVATSAPLVRALLSSLQGKATRSNRLHGYTEYPAFGCLQDWNESQILALLGELEEFHLLMKRAGRYEITEKGAFYSTSDQQGTF